MQQRILVVGDIHGGLLALQEVLANANVSSNDKLIFLGDYVDGWSQSPQVLDFLINLQEKQLYSNSSMFCGYKEKIFKQMENFIRRKM